MQLKEQRKQWEQEASKVPLPKDITTSEEVIAGVECVWVTDKNSTRDKVLVYLHGGGLVAGSAKTHLHFAATLAIAIGSPVLLVNYRLLPEHKYPAPLEDLLLVYHALLSERHFTPDQIILGGDSSGSGLLLAALVQLKETDSPLPSRVFSVSGAFDMTLSGESMQSKTNLDPHMAFEELKKWQENYLQFDLKSPLLSPFFADLANLPPVLLLVGGQEPWLSDSVNVAQKIREVDGDAQLHVWDAMGHVWIMDSTLQESKEAVEMIAKFICGAECVSSVAMKEDPAD